MGKDKSLLPFANFNSLIEFQYNKLSKVFSKVYISTKQNINFIDDSLLIYDNKQNISSPMVAMQSIFTKLSSKVFILTVDSPLVKEETIIKLCMDSLNYDVTIAKDINNVHNLCGVFSCNLLTKINRYQKEEIHRINYLLKNSNTQYITFNDSSQFININKESDYTKALLLYKKF